MDEEAVREADQLATVPEGTGREAGRRPARLPASGSGSRAGAGVAHGERSKATGRKRQSGRVRDVRRVPSSVGKKSVARGGRSREASALGKDGAARSRRAHGAGPHVAAAAGGTRMLKPQVWSPGARGRARSSPAGPTVVASWASGRYREA